MSTMYRGVFCLDDVTKVKRGNVFTVKKKKKTGRAVVRNGETVKETPVNAKGVNIKALAGWEEAREWERRGAWGGVGVGSGWCKGYVWGGWRWRLVATSCANFQTHKTRNGLWG